MSTENTSASAAASVAPAPQPEVSSRLLSLDALRGFDMIWIAGFGLFLVTLAKATGSEGLFEAVKRQCEHAPWSSVDYGRWAQGVTCWDLIMPLFLFCTGTSMPFSMAKRRKLGESTARIYGHILVRVAVLWVLGMIAQGRLLAFDLSKLQVFSNTLQAIAAGYLIAAVAYLHCGRRGRIALAAGLLALYEILLRCVPVPGATEAVIRPDQNPAQWVDTALLGRFDDGLPYTWVLSSLGFGASVLLGVFAGEWVRTRHLERTKVLGLVGVGGILAVAGFVWGGWSPINKYLWSSSMVLYWGGWSALLLGVFYLVFDVLGWRRLAFPFVVVGSNAITAYMIGHLVNFLDIARKLVGGLEHHLPAAYPAICTGTSFLLVWLFLWWMYRTKTFLKV